MPFSVVRNVEPTPIAFAESDPLDQLKIRLPRSGHVDARLSGATVVLSGEVASYYDKQVSQEAARRVPGVERVLNLIVVQPRRGTAEWIARPQLLDAV